MSWMIERNSLIFVNGRLLKKAAIESLVANENSEGSREVEIFCEFLVNKAFYYD